MTALKTLAATSWRADIQGTDDRRDQQGERCAGSRCLTVRHSGRYSAAGRQARNAVRIRVEITPVGSLSPTSDWGP